MPASVRSATTGKNAGGNTFTVSLPPGMQAGDLWVVAVLTGTATGYTTDNGPKKWWKLDGWDVNTRQYSLFARIYNPTDATSDYTLTQNASANTKFVSVAVQDHAVTQVSDIIIGARWRRGDNGGSQGPIVMPSLTTTLANMLVLGVTGEASNALGGYTVPTPAGFSLVTEIPEGTTAAVEIEWVTIWSKLQATASATGAFTLTYGSVVSLNGVGQQIAIPSAAVVLPSTGRISSRIPTSVTHNSITMGVDRVGGDVVEIAAKLGATEVSRKTVTIDPTSGWGSATFDGLSADTHYGFAFYVDGVLQTDTGALVRTYPTPGTPTSFKFVAGSCQFTGSNHPIWDRIREEGARGLGHMGDLNYADTTDPATWRTAVESSLSAPRFRAMLGLLPMTWTWDNHDRIIVDDGGAGSALNFGRTDPATLTNWKNLAGTTGWASSDSGGRTWVIGRVRFIQTDQWTNKTDPDAGLVPANQQTFLGAAQKQWFKDTLDAATEPIIVWLCQWTTATTGSGRWNSYNTETNELTAFINARPSVKSRLVMIGGDSHSVQVTDGSRTTGNFSGIPSFNISGFNRSSDSGQGGGNWNYDGPLRTSAQPEADWGGYSRMTFTDDGTTLTMLWEGVRVGPDGTTDVMTSQTIVKQPDAIPVVLSGEGWTNADIVPVIEMGVSLYGEGELQASAVPVVDVGTAHSGSGAFQAAVDATVEAAAPLSGSGTLTAATEAVVEVQASFTGSGSLTAVVAFEEIAVIEAPFTGSGTTAAATAGVLVGETDAPFSGSGSLAAATSAEVIADVLATFSGSGYLTADVTSILSAEVVADFTGSGSLDVASTADLAAAVDALFSGAGILTASTVTDQSAEVEVPFSGSGEFTADLSVELIASVDAIFTGTGLLSLVATTEQVLDASFSGSGNTSAVVSSEDLAVVEALFTGSGSLSAPIEIHIEVPAPFSSSGGLTADITASQSVAANFGGSGTLSAVAWAQTPDGSQVYLGGKLVILSLGGQTVTISR